MSLFETSWEPTATTLLCEVRGSGRSFTDVAKELGISRAAAIGKFNRLRLETKGLTKADLNYIALMISREESFEQIAINLGVSVGAIEAHFAVMRLGLGPQAN